MSYPKDYIRTILSNSWICPCCNGNNSECYACDGLGYFEGEFCGQEIEGFGWSEWEE